MTETPTVDSASTFSGPEKAHSPLFLSSSHQNGIWSTLRQEGQPYFQGIGSAKQGSNTALGLGCQSRSLDSKMQHAGTLNEEQLRSLWLKERKNKQTNKTIRTLLFFFPPPSEQESSNLKASSVSGLLNFELLSEIKYNPFAVWLGFMYHCESMSITMEFTW